jgi:hypothetical protein
LTHGPGGLTVGGVRGRLLLLAATALLMGLPAPAAVAGPPGSARKKKRIRDCRRLPGEGTRAEPWRIPSHNYHRTIVRCPGFPVGHGLPDFYVFRVPKQIDDNDAVAVRSRPTAFAPADVILAMDDLGPFALNIYGDRVIHGRYVWHVLRLADVQGLYPGLWYLRAERLSRSAAPWYRVYVDLR